MYATVKRDLEDRKHTLVDYLLSKVGAGDWHAVQDAASDIREIEAQLTFLRQHAEPSVDLQVTPGHS